MPLLNRRQFMRTSGAAVALSALTGRVRAAYGKLKIGAPDWNLRLEATPGSVELAKSIGFDGVQISLGHSPDAKNPPAHLPAGEPELFRQLARLGIVAATIYPGYAGCAQVLRQHQLVP